MRDNAAAMRATREPGGPVSVGLLRVPVVQDALAMAVLTLAGLLVFAPEIALGYRLMDDDIS